MPHNLQCTGSYKQCIRQFRPYLGKGVAVAKLEALPRLHHAGEVIAAHKLTEHAQRVHRGCKCAGPAPCSAPQG